MKTEVNQFLWVRRFASDLLRRWRKLVGLLKKKEKTKKIKIKRLCIPVYFRDLMENLPLAIFSYLWITFFSVDHIHPTNTQRRNLLTRDHWVDLSPLPTPPIRLTKLINGALDQRNFANALTIQNLFLSIKDFLIAL